MRPVGVTVIAVVAAIGGLYGLVGALALTTMSSISGGVAGMMFASGLVSLGYAALALAVAYGFWDLRPWAWPLGIGLAGLAVVDALLRYAGGQSSAFEVALVVGIAGVVARYLFTLDVQDAFGRNRF